MKSLDARDGSLFVAEVEAIRETPPPEGADFSAAVTGRRILTVDESKQEILNLKNELRATQTMLDESNRRRVDAEKEIFSLKDAVLVAEQFKSVIEVQRLELLRLSAIEQSSYWRAGVRGRQFLSRHPRLKSVLRFLLTRACRVFRSARR